MRERTSQKTRRTNTGYLVVQLCSTIIKYESSQIIDMMDTISSILSSVLSGLRVYLAEKHIKQDQEEATSPSDRIIAAPF